jgi:hypothetical protein
MRIDTMATKLKPEPKTAIERVAAISQRYGAMISKQAELLERYDAVQAEARPIAERCKIAMASWQAQLPKPPPPKPIVRSAAAVALIGSDLLSPQPEAEINPPPPPPTFAGQFELRALTEEAENIQEALRLLAGELTSSRKQHSQKVAEERGEAYKAIVSNIVDISLALGAAIEEHHGFLNEVRLDSAAWRYLRPVDLTAFGELSEAGSILVRLVTDAVEKKHVGAGKIPKWNPALSLSMLQNLGD